MVGRLGIVSLVFVGIVACSSPDWVGQAPGATAPKASGTDGGGASDGTAEDIDCVEDGASATPTATDKPGIDVELASLKTCCEDKGQAHCVPTDKVPESTRSSLTTCSSGGSCIPDSIIQGVAPKACDSGYGDGVCVSLCVKAVADNASLLKQATCATNEVCAPCVSPLDNKRTGVCELGKAKAGSTSAPKRKCPPKDAGASTAEPVTPPASPPPSGGGTTGATDCCGGKGVCVPESAVPSDQRENLEQKECAEAKLCAPRENIDKNFVPKSCTGESFTGSYEGVCLSNCIVFDFLQQAMSARGTCDRDHRCMPCKTPFGTDTGAPGCQ